MRRLFANIELLSNWCFKAGLVIAISILFLMTLLVTVTAIGRKFGFVTGFVDEVSGYGMVALIFLGLAHTLKAGKHIEITVVTDRLPPRGRRWLKVATSVIGLAFLGWLFRFTLKYAIRSYTLGSVSMTPLRVTLWPLEMLIPLGLALLALAIVLETIKIIRSEPVKGL